MANKFTDALNGFLRKVFYNERLTCASCGADVFSDGYFCGRCEKELPFNGGFVCSKCGRHIGSDYPVCLECKADMPSYTKARSPFSYEGEIVRLIKNFKTGKKYLADLFSEYMAETAAKEFAGADLIVFVPMTERAAKKRGYNQARLLAENVARIIGKPCSRLLKRDKHAENLARMNRRERAEAIKGTITELPPEESVEDKTLLLVDDVMTTSATADECCRALVKLKPARIYVLTFATSRSKPFLYR